METKKGRPPKPEGQGAGEVFQIRLTSAEKAAWREASELSGIKLAAWIRDRLNRASARELKNNSNK